MTEATKNKTIVVAEDDPFISGMYQTKLEQSGYKVELLNNGRDAYEAIKKHHPDMVIMDINMPEISGLAVLEALKAEGFDMSGTPVIVLTNSGESKDRDKATALGAMYMVKADVTPHDILKAIESKLK